MAVSKFASWAIHRKNLHFTYKTRGGKTVNVLSDKPVVQIGLPVDNSSKTGTVNINNNGEGLIFTRIIMEGIPEAGQEMEFSNNLKLDVTYLTRDGKALDVTSLAQGTDFIAKVSVYNPGEYYYRDLALTQVFPPGWEITNNRMWENEMAVSKDNPTYQDIRDDRIYTYFDLGRESRKTFTVQLNAAYLGKYYLTGAYCEAMYDNSISAMKKGEWVEISRTGE